MDVHYVEITKMLEGRTMKNFIVILFAVILIVFSCSKDKMSASDSGSSSGEGGSMAAMTIMGDYMYRIAGGNSVEVYDISADSSAKLSTIINPGTGLETLFPYGNYLLIGTTSGMHIYDVSNGASPTFVSTYSHVVSCDPVVAQGNYAYVTLRNGTRCARGLTQLEVIDLSDINSPKLIKTVPMLLPHGLDADGSNLIVGEGSYGFKWFDIADPTDPKQLVFENKVPCFDVISRGNNFIVVGQNGLYQYKYGAGILEKLSVIPITANAN
jgi:hypothetical protein